jgi:hypothetical protein
MLPLLIMLSRFTVSLLFCLLTAAAWAAPPLSTNLGTDLDGHTVHRLAPPDARAVVLFFAASDCPISNRYIPEIERLDREFSSEGVHFWWVYPNPEDTADVIRRHEQQFDIHSAALLDTEQRLTAMAHATITPEVAVLLPAGSSWREVYRGRIDNRYLSLGRERSAATRHDLEDALRAVIAGRPVPAPEGPPVGCSIVPRNIARNGP